MERECQLEPQRAAELAKAAEWVQMSGIAGSLSGVTDPGVLFLLSADATPEDVREWFMERAAAGDVPSREGLSNCLTSRAHLHPPDPSP